MYSNSRQIWQSGKPVETPVIYAGACVDSIATNRFAKNLPMPWAMPRRKLTGVLLLVVRKAAEPLALQHPHGQDVDTLTGCCTDRSKGHRNSIERQRGTLPSQAQKSDSAMRSMERAEGAHYKRVIRASHAMRKAWPMGSEAVRTMVLVTRQYTNLGTLANTNSRVREYCLQRTRDRRPPRYQGSGYHYSNLVPLGALN